MAAALIVVLLLLAALAWLIFGGGDDPDTGAKQHPDIDRDELREAETEVRDAQDPDDIRDWGPGVPKDKSH